MAAAPSAEQRIAVPQAHGGMLMKPPKGVSGNPYGVSRERRELSAAIETREIPKVHALLQALYERAMDGDLFAAKMWLDQVRGPIKPRKDDDELESTIELKLMEMISEARRRRDPAP